jgi:hypothetical protein
MTKYKEIFFTSFKNVAEEDVIGGKNPVVSIVYHQ